MCAFCCYRRRKAGRAHVITAATHPPGQFMTSTDRLRTGAARNANSSVTELLLPHCHRFTYAELAAATGGFAEGNVLGEGGFGRVYKGVLRDGKSVAVKRLDRGGLQGDKEFNVEISTLAALRHANLVTLLGICTEGDHRLAAFEFAQHGSLRSALDVSTPGSAAAAGGGRSRQGPLRWQQRLEIALGAARGLAYMHEVAKPAIIHRDFKSTNILVDAAGQARICDFGLARRLHGLPSARSGGSLRHGESSGGALNTMVMGTFGYVAPEYAATGHLSEKSDVYSFGVVLLELLTGLNPVDVSRQPGRQSLVEWLMPALHDLTVLQRHLDPHLGSVESQVPQLAALAEVASACLQLDPARRPRMGEVVSFLEPAVCLFDAREPQPAARAGDCGRAGVGANAGSATAGVTSMHNGASRLQQQQQEHAHSGGPSEQPRQGAVDTSMHDLVITASTSTMDDYTIAVAERRTMYTPGFDDAFASTTPERSPFDAPSVSTASPAGAVEEYTQAAPGCSMSPLANGLPSAALPSTTGSASHQASGAAPVSMSPLETGLRYGTWSAGQGREWQQLQRRLADDSQRSPLHHQRHSSLGLVGLFPQHQPGSPQQAPQQQQQQDQQQQSRPATTRPAGEAAWPDYRAQGSSQHPPCSSPYSDSFPVAAPPSPGQHTSKASAGPFVAAEAHVATASPQQSGQPLAGPQAGPSNGYTTERGVPQWGPQTLQSPATPTTPSGAVPSTFYQRNPAYSGSPADLPNMGASPQQAQQPHSGGAQHAQHAQRPSNDWWADQKQATQNSPRSPPTAPVLPSRQFSDDAFPSTSSPGPAADPPPTAEQPAGLGQPLRGPSAFARANTPPGMSLIAALGLVGHHTGASRLPSGSPAARLNDSCASVVPRNGRLPQPSAAVNGPMAHEQQRQQASQHAQHHQPSQYQHPQQHSNGQSCTPSHSHCSPQQQPPLNHVQHGSGASSLDMAYADDQDTVLVDDASCMDVDVNAYECAQPAPSSAQLAPSCAQSAPSELSQGSHAVAAPAAMPDRRLAYHLSLPRRAVRPTEDSSLRQLGQQAQHAQHAQQLRHSRSLSTPPQQAQQQALGPGVATPPVMAESASSLPAAALPNASLDLSPLRNGLIRALHSVPGADNSHAHPSRVQGQGSGAASKDKVHLPQHDQPKENVPHSGPESPSRARASGGVCLVCLDAPRDWTIMPCGHAAACRPCALSLRQNAQGCPVCHGHVTGVLHRGVSEQVVPAIPVAA